MTQAFSEESELVEPLDAVNENLIGFGAKGHPLAARADFEVSHFVGVGDLGDGLSLIAVPKEDGAARASGHEFKLVIPALTHSCVETVCSLPHLNALLLLQVVSAEGAISAAGVDDIGLGSVREQSNDVLLLVYSLQAKKQHKRLAALLTALKRTNLPLNWMRSWRVRRCHTRTAPS